MDVLKADFEYFVTVAEAGSLSRAAELLRVRQSTLSKSMQRLEKGLRCELLIRHAGGVRLTPAGQRLVGRVRGLREEWDRIRSETLSEASEVSGRVAFGAHAIVAVSTLDRFLPSLLARHPKLEARVAIGTSRVVVEEVLDFRLDFGFAIDPPRHPELVLLPLRKERVSYWRAKGAAAPERDLRSGSANVIYNPQLIGVEGLLNGLAPAGMSYARLTPVEDYATGAALARAGAGVVLLPEPAAEGLILADAKAPHREARLNLVYRADAQRGPTARAVLAAIRKAFPGSKGA